MNKRVPHLPSLTELHACLLYIAVLALLVFVSQTSAGSNTTEDLTINGITVDAISHNATSLPDFDGDGTIGFGDFVIFAGVFGARQGDGKYDATYDLNGDGEIGFSDFVIFAQNFGKEVPSPVVTIPDANLRAAIEVALGKASDAPITQAEMATLDSLEASDADITDLTGLEFTVNLTWLDLSSNDITNISVLEGLTNLTHLILSSNNITDLAGLVANTGLGTGDNVDITGNPLNVTSQSTHIPSLQTRGVRVTFVHPAVAIPDPNLRAAIEAALGKASGTPITQVEMATLDSLEASDADTTDLTGLEFAVNLTYLNLNDNDIADISSLSGLTNLTRLWLSNNSIGNISSLSKLTNLTELWLWNNQIEDISSLSGLTNLTRLSLGRNNITDIRALAGLTNLKMLFLQNNHISDLAPLAANKGLGRGSQVDVTKNPLNAASHSTHVPALQARGVTISYVPSPIVKIPDANLRAAIEAALGKASGAPIIKAEMVTLPYLAAQNAGIGDLTGLESATNLTDLWLPNNSITDIRALGNLTNLTELELDGNNIRDLSPLGGLTNLTELGLGLNNITNVSALRSLTNLTELGLRLNNIRDLSPLSGLTNLTELQLRGNHIRDLSPLSGLTNLTYLQLRGNNITEVSALGSLTNLSELWLNDNHIRDLSPLSGLTNLTHLQLRGNNIRDLSALSGLTNLTHLQLPDLRITDQSRLPSLLGGLVNLEELALSYIGITDISALGSLTNLRRLYLSGNNIRDLSPLVNLTNLTYLWLRHNNITDVSPLGSLTNLAFLQLGDNNITDVLPLGSLTNLAFLQLGDNNITDVSPLGSLTNLSELWLNGNNITDLSALSGLTNLTYLALESNMITDVSVLGSLTNLTYLTLAFNTITDVSALSGLTNLWELELQGNPLSVSAINDHIPALESNGARVRFDSFRKGDFDIELVFLGSFNDRQKSVLQYAARRWMAVITEDLPDHEFTVGWSGTCGGQSYEIPSGDRIDDLRIYVGTFERGPAAGYGSPTVLREETHLPALGCMAFDSRVDEMLIVGLHEIGHVLGFGTIWTALGFLQNPPNGDTYFSGPLAIAAFDDAGGRDYTGAKVPVAVDRVHWRPSIFWGEVMTGARALSAITVQSMADLGYGVNVSQADAYTLLGATAGKASAKVAVVTPAIPGIGVDVTQPHTYTLPGANPDWHGRLASGPPSIFLDVGRTGQLEDAEKVWGHGINFGISDDRRMWRAAPATQTELKLTCGVSSTHEPISVVDRQGRLIRIVGH